MAQVREQWLLSLVTPHTTHLRKCKRTGLVHRTASSTKIEESLHADDMNTQLNLLEYTSFKALQNVSPMGVEVVKLRRSSSCKSRVLRHHNPMRTHADDIPIFKAELPSEYAPIAGPILVIILHLVLQGVFG